MQTWGYAVKSEPSISDLQVRSTSSHQKQHTVDMLRLTSPTSIAVESPFSTSHHQRGSDSLQEFIEANLPIEIELTYGRDLSDLILRLTDTNPDRRLTDHSIALRHPFLQARDSDQWVRKQIQIREPLNLVQPMAEMVGDMIVTESSDDEDEVDDEDEESVRPPRLYGKPPALKKSLRVRMTNLGTFILTETVNGVTIDLMRGGHRTGDTEEFRCADCDRRIFIDTGNKNWRFVRESDCRGC